MPTLELLSGPVTLSTAMDSDLNYLPRLKYPQQRRDFYARIESHRSLMKTLVRHHLDLSSTTTVHISPQTYWRHGSFNLVIPINVVSDDSSVPPFIMIRFPLPYRVGEAKRPGNSDEKLRCEAATYAWLSEHCPTVPIPQLYGFGLSNNQRLTHLRFRPWWSRWLHRGWRYVLALLRLPCPSLYVSHNSTTFAPLDIGYLLIETISEDEGIMLSETWDENKDNVCMKDNLNNSLVRILLSLTKIALPRIGSFRIDDFGYVRLNNRPLHTRFTVDESEDIPTDKASEATLASANQLVLRHLDSFDNRLTHQPNACNSAYDGRTQMASLAVARAVFPCMFRRDLAEGPFVFSFTDLHRSNILVDKDWNITRIIDLEFACVWPLEFQHPPYWLGGHSIDEIDPAEYGPHHARFIEALENEEKLQQRDWDKNRELLSSIMRRAWTSGAFWAFMAIQDPMSFSTLIWQRILPDHLSFSVEEVEKLDVTTLSRFWRPDIDINIEKKLQDREKYLIELENTFHQSEGESGAIDSAHDANCS